MTEQRLIIGHVLERLAELPAASIALAFTSHPYLGLRAYGTAGQVWGGDGSCEHDFESTEPPPTKFGRAGSTDAKQHGRLAGINAHRWSDEVVVHLRGQAGEHASAGNTVKEVAPRQAHLGQRCQRCGAWYGELGSEDSIAQHLANLTEVYRAVRRVLRPDGSLWVNIGDGYSAGVNGRLAAEVVGDDRAFRDRASDTSQLGVPAKSLLLMPERFALAMAEDGWMVRERHYWFKRTPMPESTADRSTTAVEWVYRFVLTGQHYSDQDAVREPNSPLAIQRFASNGLRSERHHWQGMAGMSRAATAGREWRGDGRNARNWHTYPVEEYVHHWMGHHDWDYCQGCDALYVGRERRQIVSRPICGQCEADNQWATAATGAMTCGGCGESYDREARRRLAKHRYCPVCQATDQWIEHYAAFPDAMPRFAIAAATPPMCCPHCGAGWQRIVAKDGQNTADEAGIAALAAKGVPRTTANLYATRKRGTRRTVGWEPGCACPHTEAETVPATVLDPFVGSGTTLLAALHLGRNGIGIELQPGYARAAAARLERAQRERGPVRVTGTGAYQQAGLGV
jgi:DNA modification methylase